MIYTFVVIIFSIGYIALILYYYKEWSQLHSSELSDHSPSAKVSVIIPARNESLTIQNCIQSILRQNYPAELLEIIVVDDHSTDDTAQKVLEIQNIQVQLIKLADIKLNDGEVAYKKRSIEVGVKQSDGEFIVTTDADCTHSMNWIRSLVQEFETQERNIISAPVLFNYSKNTFQQFQALDFIGMLGITAASLKAGMYNLANGANLAFRKSIFYEVDGYKGIDSKASGDDMLLIYKFAQVNASKVVFLKSKDAVVNTQPAVSMSEFIQQRLRWTSKSFTYQDSRITFILAFVYLVNVLLVISFVAGILCLSTNFLLLFLLQFGLMSLVDYFFLSRVCDYFNRKDLLKSFIPSQLMHVVYI